MNWLLEFFLWILLPALAVLLLYYRKRGGQSSAPYILGLSIVLGLLALVLGSGIGNWTQDSPDLEFAAFYGLLPALSIATLYYAIRSKHSFSTYFYVLGATMVTLVALVPLAASQNTYPGGGWYAFVTYAWPDYWGKGSPEFALLATAISLGVVLSKKSRGHAKR